MTRFARVPVLAACLAAFVVGVDAIRALRPALLLDPDPSWAGPRLALGLGVIAVSASAGIVAAFLLSLAAGLSAFGAALEPLAFSRRALAALFAAALIFGGVVRFAGLERIPWPLWIDDVSLVETASSLTGTWRDFADSIRPLPGGGAPATGTVGVAWLELFRLSLRVFGTTVFGLRFPAAAAGVLSLLTASLLARKLLPRGGGTLAAVALAGMRWSVILSRWGWVAVAVTPVLDLAALAMLEARESRRTAWAVVSGAAAGAAAHFYLAAWVAAAALSGLAVWPADPAGRGRRAARAALFLAGFAVFAAPLFLFRSGRSEPYFLRAGRSNVATEIERTRSFLPALAAASDALVAPWLSDPLARHDLSGCARLGWVLGIAVAVALVRSVLRPRDALSAYLLTQCAAAVAAATIAGQAHLPNGFRFAYLASPLAVAAAGGGLALRAGAGASSRRLVSLPLVGLFAAASLLGARDALFVWPDRRATFDAFYGEDTLVGRAAARWSRLGRVSVDPSLGFDPRTHSPVMIAAIERFRLEPGARRLDRTYASAFSPARSFRVAPPAAAPSSGERVVERVRDAWGRERAIVLGKGRPSRTRS